MVGQHTTNRTPIRARWGLAALLAIAILASVGTAAASAGDPFTYLDFTFGGTGLVLSDFTAAEDGADAVTIGADGGIVAAGFGDLADPSRPHVAGFAFAKYLPSGAPDPTFSGDGLALVDFGFVNQAATTADVDSADRVVATGTITTFDGSTSSIGVARLLPDGGPDPGFNDDGLVTIQPGILSTSYDAAVDAADRVVVLGAATGAKGFRPIVVRFTEDGSLDQSFGDGGIKRFGKVGRGLYKAIAVDGRGRLLIAGSFQPRGSKHEMPAVRRMSSTGAFDPKYGRDGLAFPLGRIEGEIPSLTVDASGRTSVVATCGCGPQGDDDFAVGRLTPSGRADRSFSGDGRIFVGFGAREARPTSIAIDPSGRIVAAGSVRVAGDNDWALIRLNRDGTLDTGFGEAGTITAALGGGVEGVRGLAVDGDSRIVAAGLGIGPDSSDFAVARFR